MLKQKRIVISTALIFILFSIAALAATLYPSALVSFSGINLKVNNTSVSTPTTQGFVDITLKNVRASGISFCLSYDMDYVSLSDVNTNEPIQNPTSELTKFNIKHTYFKQNEDAFPIGVFKDANDVAYIPTGVLLPIIGIADQDASYSTGHVIMNFVPEVGSESESDYIENDSESEDDYPLICADTSDGIKIGSISFNIKDPVAFSQLSPSQLQQVIKVVPYAEMMGDNEEFAADEGVRIAYVNDDDIIKFSSHLEYDFSIKPDLSDVQPQVDELSVTSYEIYNDGTIQDLVDFLNEKMSLLTLNYADGSFIPGVFEWKDDTDANFSDYSWDPKGGDYTITQKYNDDFDITVTVHVTPVTLIGFDYEKKYKTYLKGADDFPKTVGALDFPNTVRPVLDTYIQNGGIKNFGLEWYSFDDNAVDLEDPIPAEFENAGEYTFEGHISEADDNYVNDYPWLTVNYPVPEVDLIRAVVDSEDDLPKALTVVSAVTDDSGVLTITVEYSDGTPIPSGTTFSIKMPGGELIDTDALGDHYTVTFNDGKAIVALAPDITIAAEKKTAQMINLGNRAGAFAISAKEPTKPAGDYTSFSPDPRNNYYLDSYVFDYSGVYSAMFPVKVGDTIPTTVTLAYTPHRVETTYSGYDGTEAGSLKTFTVESWTPDASSGDPSQPGDVISIVGVLKNTSYTNYGNVSNNNSNTVTIKYVVSESDATESIENIPDFTYDKQQIGYSYDKLQTHTFKVKNTGTADINGLTAVISLTSDNRDAYMITKELVPILKKNGSLDLDISTMIGLPIGTHVATVSILSDNSASPLDTFKLTFEVTERPTYNITLTVNNADMGTAKTQTDTYTAMQGDEITIIATPKNECAFIRWQVESGDVTISNPNLQTQTFIMPDSNVEIRAVFKETSEALLRCDKLYVMDADETDTDQSEQLCDEDWNNVTYDPKTREYYVAVANDVESIKLWFKPRTEAEDAYKSVRHEHDGSTNIIYPAPAYDAGYGYYISGKVPLYESPTENTVSLILNKQFDEDEGYVQGIYKLHIYRKKKNSDLMTFNPGNSPFGLIERDGSITDKSTAQTQFLSDGYMFKGSNVPAGATANIPYLKDAWNSDAENCDLDPTALFVINNEEFYDPGYSAVQNSIGGEVTAVTKKVTVQKLREEQVAKQNGSSQDMSYVGAATVTLPATGMINQLMDIRIRPDVYELSYSFVDFNGDTTTVKKPIIVLSSLGDVNVSGTADATDVWRILHRFDEDLDLADKYNTIDYDPGGLLFKYRVCDINKDGNVNAIDANNLRIRETVPLKQFYTNLTEGSGS